MALPAPTALVQTVTYTKFSTTRYCWVPTIAIQSAPTLAELNAGKDLTLQIEAVAGFSTTTASIDVPRAGTTFTGNMPGRKTAAGSSLTFYLSQTGPTVDVRSLITEGLTGFVVIFNEGIVTGGGMDVWPVRVGSVQVMQDIEAVASALIEFYVPAQPSTNLAVPTV